MKIQQILYITWVKLKNKKYILYRLHSMQSKVIYKLVQLNIVPTGTCLCICFFSMHDTLRNLDLFWLNGKTQLWKYCEIMYQTVKLLFHLLENDSQKYFLLWIFCILLIYAALYLVCFLICIIYYHVCLLIFCAKAWLGTIKNYKKCGKR